MNEEDYLIKGTFSDKQLGKMPNVRKLATGHALPILSGERRFAESRVVLNPTPPGCTRSVTIGHIPGEGAVEMSIVFEVHMLEALLLVANASTGRGVVLPNLAVRIRRHYDQGTVFDTVSFVSDTPQPWDTTKLKGPGV